MLNIKKVRGILKADLGLQMPQYIYENGKFILKYPLDWKLRINLLISDGYLKSNKATVALPIIKPQLNTEEEDTYKALQRDDLVQNIGNGLMFAGLGLGNKALIGAGYLGNNIYSSIKNLKGKPIELKTLGYSNMIGNTLDFGGDLLFDKSLDSALKTGLDNTYDAISSGIMKINPIVGAGMKLGSFIGDGLNSVGLGTDQMTTADLILDSNFLKLTPIGLINSFGNKKTDKFSTNYNTLERVGGSYGGSISTINSAQLKLNKRYGLFSNRARKKANSLIGTATQLLNDMTGIANTVQDLKDMINNTSDLFSINYHNKLNGGYFAKLGMKLEAINNQINLETKQVEWKPIITEPEWSPVITDPIDSYREGGKTEELEAPKIEETSLKNIIPEGALHKNKHHMENDKNITKKGIPVIDNNGELQAEIELNEIIFTLEVTKKLEELYKKYNNLEGTQKEKDEAATEAGKLLVKEILFNTDDKTGLINTLKLGGKINEPS